MNNADVSALIFQYVHRVVELVPTTSVGLLDCTVGCSESQLAIAEQTLLRSIASNAELLRWPDGTFSVVLAGASFEETVSAAERARDAVAASAYLRDCRGLRVGLSWCIAGADPHALMGGLRDALDEAERSGESIVVAPNAPIEAHRAARDDTTRSRA